MLDLNLIAIRYRLGLLNAELLVQTADELVDEQRDTAAVVQLLILESPVHMEDAAPLFERACAELGFTIPTKAEAINKLLRFHLESIASGARVPREGLSDIMRELYYPHFSNEPTKEYDGDSRGLEHLIGCYWGYDDLTNPGASFQGKHGQDAIPLYDELVRQHARDWLKKAD